MKKNDFASKDAKRAPYKGKGKSKFSPRGGKNGSNRGKAPRIEDGLRANITLDHMSSESPRLSTSAKLVFPEDAATMQAFGNYTTTPGQENFITEFNVMLKSPDASQASTHPTLTPVWKAHAKRTTNVMCIEVCPLFGPTDQINKSTLANPITMAGLNLKQFIDTSFGTKTDYDPQDLMLYLMGVAGVFPLIAEIKRDLRLTYTVMENQYPQFVPKGLFAALGIKDGGGQWGNGQGYLYTAAHLREFVDKLNQFIFAFNRLPIPPELSVLGYNDDLFDAIWLDSPDVQTAQLYVFKNSDYWEYIETAAPYPSLCHWPLGARSVNEKLTILGVMVEKLTALRTSSTAMLQNLFNAYGSKDTIQLAALDINNLEPLPFVYNENILTMIENMVICDAGHIDISHFAADPTKQSVTGHVAIYDMDTGGFGITLNVPLQFHKDWDQITHDDIGWAMRLHPMFNLQKKDTVYSNRFTSGSEWDSYYADACMGFGIVTFVQMVSISDDGNLSYVTCDYNTAGWSYITARDFHYAPIMRTGTFDSATGYIRNADYYANRDVEVTYRIGDMVMYWVYLTNTLWAANVNRNAPGTRFKGRADSV